ncbi:MAG: efflux RND transporter permease subunit, partial [Treponema sp.]|nr:efflux RND transporter permease subunit [Treponema sp.]
FRGGGIVGGQFEPPRQVFLRDIANVMEDFRDETSSVVVNGNPAVTMSVTAQSGANAVQPARDLRAQLAGMKGELPPDVEITELFNTTDLVENSLNQVTSTAVSGAVLAVVFLFLFLRSFKSTFIIGLSIPVSVLITFMMMYFAGLTLNLMTMAGLVLGIGMLIDNSIVILENIYRYREKGAKLQPAAILGTTEMIKAITVSTLSTLCVFLPLIMFYGLLEVYGEIFSGLAFTIAISLGVSLFVALFLVPVLASHHLPLVTRKQKPLKGKLARIDAGFEGFFRALDNGYRRLVDRILRKKALTVGILAVLFVGSVVAIPRIGWEPMPNQEQDSVQIRATLPVGTPLPYTEAVLRQFQAIVEREIPGGYQDLIINAGAAGGMMGLFSGLGGSGTNSGTLRISLKPFAERTATATEIQDRLRPYFNQFPDVVFDFSSQGMGFGGSAVEVIIRTDDMTRGLAVARRVSELVGEIEGTTEPQISLTEGLPQLELVIDRERMYVLGLNTLVVGNEIRAAVDGVTATRFRSGGTDLDVVLILAEADRNSRPALDSLFVNSQLVGGRVPLSNFVSFREGTGPLTISRENQGRVIRVTAGARPGTQMNVLQDQVVAAVNAGVVLDDDIIIDYGGGNSEMTRIAFRFGLISIVAIFLVFGVMASLFESFRDPFIIIFTIPLSLIGIVAIYAVSSTLFNVLTLVGLLVLIGVITNNGIVLVDYTNLLRKRGMALHEACVEAAGTRLRPILMTTLTTVVGLVPMAFFPGEGSEIVSPIGLTVLGGLSFGTLMTLFLMPTLYYIINRRADQRAAKRLAWRERVAAGRTGKEQEIGARSMTGTTEA